MSPEDGLADAIDAVAARRPDQLVVVGLCGAQGSGKSTLAAALTERIGRAATLSLDDLYLTLSERETLARDVHPLLRTRGVPGTHDLDLGLAVIDALRAGRATPLPRFDKAIDDRLPPAAWPLAPAGTRVLLLEGWCVGARSQPTEALAEPVNELERREDQEGIWRTYVNAALAGSYQRLFGRIDHLALLAAPGWDAVLDWRLQQERALRQARGDHPGVMNDSQVARFIAHYERLTRHILSEMPSRADTVVRIDRQRDVLI